MNDHRAVVADVDHGLEAFAAELTAAAYPVALRHGVGGKWLDLELDLWRVLTETLKQWGAGVAAGRMTRGCPPAPFTRRARS